jgi:ubiquinone/menaquinone biosynthesis C-methylase UbiE
MRGFSSDEVEVVEYGAGLRGYTDASTYDALRYRGPADEYKQRVMEEAYLRLVGPLQGRRVLDVGCGTGRGVLRFAREAALAAGVDASRDMLAAAARKANGAAPALARAYGQRLPYRDGAFEVVTALNFLHLFSLEVQKRLIAEMKRVVRPGGRLVLEFDNALQGVWIGIYKRLSGQNTGLLLPGEIRYALGDGCRVTRIHGAVFPVLWRVLHRIPPLAAPVERAAYFPPFNHLAHRVYYQEVRAHFRRVHVAQTRVFSRAEPSRSRTRGNHLRSRTKHTTLLSSA